MFERNRVDTYAEKGTVSAEIMLDDDRHLVGKFIIPINKSIFDVLNGTGGFLEFEPMDADRQFISKRSLRSVKLLSVPRSQNLQAKLRSLDGFDPYTILGVGRDTDWSEIRKTYLTLAKEYHPDRYSTAKLPDEVKSYLSSMARRINAAYGALESQRDSVKAVRSPQAEPIFTSGPRG